MKRNNTLRKLFLLTNLALITSIALLQSTAAYGAWGDFDTSFGFQGATVDPITGYTPLRVAIQPDGKILVAGYRNTVQGRKGFFLRRYLSDGQLDTSFGTDGAAIGPETNTFATDYRGDAIVIQSNGKIAVAGWANGYYAVWQFNSSGIKDKTFGQNGLSILNTYPVLANSYPELNLQSSRLLLSLKKQDGNHNRIALVRLTSAGVLDTAFGNSGESLTGMTSDKGTGTVIEPDGKITIAGVRYDNLSARGLERKLSNGQNDTSFNPPTIASFGAIISGLVRMANGKYATRWGNPGSNGSMTATFDQFNSAGVFETSRATYNGFLVTGCPEIFVNQSDGKLLGQFLGLLFRLETDFTGSVETQSCSNLSGISLTARAALQTDDKMVVAGVYNNYLILVRLSN